MPETVAEWRILDILKASEEALRNKGITNARLNAELLLADTLNTERINLYLGFEKPLSEIEISRFREKIRRRMKSEPLQYIRGFTEFYGLKFNVNPGVLIPRPETELLVEKSLETAKAFENPRILEIGTGSGCLAIAIAANTECKIDAVDINPKALQTAKENAAKNGVSDTISFSEKNISSDFDNFDSFDLIVSNPPYIPLEEVTSLPEEIRLFEPLEALTDNSNGLVVYSKIFELYLNSKPGVNILLEIGDGKKEAIEKLLREHRIENFRFHKDLMGINRVLEIGAV